MKNQKSIKKLRSQRRLQRLLKKNPNIFKTPSELKSSSTKTYWFQKTKRATKKIKHLTNGRVILLSHHYRGDKYRHWVKDTHCRHLFTVSMKQIQKIGDDRTCPYCNPPVDMRSYGDINAIRNHVLELTFGNIDFLPDNTLGLSEENYSFYSYHEKRYFSLSYKAFLEAIDKCIPTDNIVNYRQAG
jgi:hypothetical protein